MIGLLVAGGTILCGLVLFAIAGIRFFTAERGIGLIAPASALLVAGLTTGTAQLGLETWSEQKRKDRTNAEYEERKSIYLELTQLMIGQLTSRYDGTKDIELRASIALWGSAQVVKTQASWQQFITEIDVSSGSVAMNEEQQMRSKRLLANSILAMRDDLESDKRKSSNQVDIMQSIFNEKNL